MATKFEPGDRVRLSAAFIRKTFGVAVPVDCFEAVHDCGTVEAVRPAGKNFYLRLKWDKPHLHETNGILSCYATKFSKSLGVFVE